MSPNAVFPADIKTLSTSSDVSLYIRREFVGNGAGTCKIHYKKNYYIKLRNEKIILPGSIMF